MRLLNIRTWDLHDFAGESVPSYAIFSHVGDGSQEVSYAEWKRVRQQERAEKLFLNSDPAVAEECRAIKAKPGYTKITRFVKALAKFHQHIEWAHMHTLCVDRTSSAEINEALSSCYRWCQRATTCLAFLDDVPADLWPLQANPEEFCGARWFRRCWTLTELVAPPEVRFFDSSFSFLSTRRELSKIICGITKIGEPFLVGNTNAKSVPAAHRLAWAARRETTKPEDVAYSLMGLLDVHMTPHYGEGEAAAFRRLQEKLLKRTGDASLLAWGFQGAGTGRAWTPAQRSGPFASHPAQFATCQGIVSSLPTAMSQARPSAEYRITNRGLWITTTILRPPFADTIAGFSTDYVYAMLGCSYEKAHVLLPLLPARRATRRNSNDGNRPTAYDCDEFWRAPSCAPICVRPGSIPMDPALRRTVLILREAPAVELLSLQIHGLDSAGYRMPLQEIWPPTVCREGVHYVPLDDGHTHSPPTPAMRAPDYSPATAAAAAGNTGAGQPNGNASAAGASHNSTANGDRRSRSNSSGRNHSVEAPRTQWILLRLWTYFENVVVMIRYQGRPLKEGPAQLLPPMSPRQVNPVDVRVKVVSMAQLMENYTSPSSESSQPTSRSLEEYFWTREPSQARLEDLFRLAPRFRHGQPVRALVRPPTVNLNHERHEQAAMRKMGYRLPSWTVELEFDSTNLGLSTSLGGL